MVQVSELELYHSFDAKLAMNIGEQSVSSHVQAILELIKNSFDADALECSVHFHADSQMGEEISMKKIVIEDSGIGMTVEDFRDKWMRVATSHKEREKYSPVLRRRVAGEKGMGRFASQRLGNAVKITSHPREYAERAESDYPRSAIELAIDWNQYVAGKDFESIPNKLRILDSTGDTHGFRIEITDLKDRWTLRDIDAIVVNAGTLVSPTIMKQSDANSFGVKIVPHGFVPKRVKIESVVERYAPWEIRAQLIGNKVNCQIYHRTRGDDERKPVSDLSARAQHRKSFHVGDETCGDAKVVLLVFEGRAREWAPKSMRKARELDAQLEENCGIKVFNDGVRVMPYGKKGDDWAGLDKRYLLQMGGRARNRNVMGYVFLTRAKNPNIIETTTREGLIQNKAFKFLKNRLVIEILSELEDYRREYDRQRQENRPKSIAIAKAQSTLGHFLDHVEGANIQDEEKSVLIQQAAEVKRQIEIQEKETTEAISRVTTNLEMYRNLASLGISALAFHHEVRQIIGRVNQRQRMLADKWAAWGNDKKQDYVHKTIDDVSTMIDLNSYVREFASLFSGPEGTKRGREMIKFVESVERFKEGFKDVLESLSIDIEVRVGYGNLDGLYMNRASWESIMINLMANSIKALTRVQRKKKYIKILFEKRERDLKIEVYDNGVGIPEDNFQKIFDPFYSTSKTGGDDGTGMGTTIVREIVEDDCKGTVRVSSSTHEKSSTGGGETTIQILIPLESLRGK